jgi:hypothetical protein
MGGEEALGMARRLEATHGAFPLSRWLVRIFRPIIQAFVLAVLDAHEDLPLGCAIAGKLVGNDHTWNVVTALVQLTEELLGCGFVSSALDEDIEHSAMLVDGPP